MDHASEVMSSGGYFTRGEGFPQPQSVTQGKDFLFENNGDEQYFSNDTIALPKALAKYPLLEIMMPVQGHLSLKGTPITA